MQLSDRVKKLSPSATLAVTAKAQELRASGKDIISLSVGEPDFPTPKYVCDAAKKAMDEGFTRYTVVAGIPELRQAVGRYYHREYGVSFSEKNIIASNGGKQCIYNALQALLNPGDHVLIPAPYWVSYPAIVELAGAKPIIVTSTAQDNFKVNTAMLNASYTPKTRVLIMNSPSNPSGICYTQKEFDAIAQWAVDHNIIILSDEIYDQLVYDGLSPLSFASWWERYPENFILVNGVAKSYCMTGWRVGYALGHEEYVKAMMKLQGQSTSNICSIAQKATIAALDGGLDEVYRMKEHFAKRRDLAFEIISSWKGVVCPKPSGAFYLFPDVSAYYTEEIADSTSLCNYLLDKAGVALVPGVAFGNDKCLRLSYAVHEDVLEKALIKLEKAFFTRA